MPNTDRAPKTEPIKEPPFGTSGGLYYPSDGAHELGRHLGLDGGGIDALHTELRECYVRAKREGEDRADHHIASTPDTGGDGAAEIAAKIAEQILRLDNTQAINNDVQMRVNILLRFWLGEFDTTPTPSPPTPDSAEGHKAGASGSDGLRKAAAEVVADASEIAFGVREVTGKLIDALAAALSDGGMGDE